MKTILKYSTLITASLLVAGVAFAGTGEVGSANGSVFQATLNGVSLSISVGDSVIQVQNNQSKATESFTVIKKMSGMLVAESKSGEGMRLQIFSEEGLEAFCDAITDPDKRAGFDVAPTQCDPDTKAAAVFLPAALGNNRTGVLLK